MKHVRLSLAAVLGATTLFTAVPAEADATMLYALESPDPASGSRCTRRTEIWHDTTRVPPVWSRGYVICS